MVLPELSEPDAQQWMGPPHADRFVPAIGAFERRAARFAAAPPAENYNGNRRYAGGKQTASTEALYEVCSENSEKHELSAAGAGQHDASGNEQKEGRRKAETAESAPAVAQRKGQRQANATHERQLVRVL